MRALATALELELQLQLALELQLELVSRVYGARRCGIISATVVYETSVAGGVA